MSPRPKCYVCGVADAQGLCSCPAPASPLTCRCGHPEDSHARIGGCAAKGSEVKCRETVRWHCTCEQFEQQT